MKALVFLPLMACANAAYHYDPKPAPTWIMQMPVNTKAGMADVVGIVMASTDLRGDQERAFDAAKQRLAESLVSEIRSQSSDFSWSKNDKDQTVVEQTVDVRTDIKLEGVTQVGAYRDEASASQYVLARIDFAALADRVSTRMRKHLDDLEHAVDDANSMKDTRTVHAFVALMKLQTHTDALIDDARLLAAIAAKDSALDRYGAVRRRIDDTRKKVASLATFAIAVTGPDPAVCDRVGAGARELMLRWGFAETKEKDPAVRLVIDLNSIRLRDERHNDRQEFVYGAEGSAHLFERAGEWTELSAALPSERYTETHASEDEAKRRALNTGADTLLSIWRSLVRATSED